MLAGFLLLLVPHIVPGTDKVMLEVIPESESLSGSGGPPLAPLGFDVFLVGSGTGEGSIALPRISSSTIHTKMLLKSGQTAVLGGLTTDSNSRSETKVPFLGDIPVLGWLFKYKTTRIEKTNLMIFIYALYHQERGRLGGDHEEKERRSRRVPQRAAF